MISKQDITSPRTPSDLERRYNFGKSFAELQGIATDAQTHAIKAEKLALDVQQKVLNINVVDKLNVSAGAIVLKANGLTIESDGFSLSAKNGIKTTKGNIGLWDISVSGITKAVGTSLLKITVPEANNGDVITIARLIGGEVASIPLSIKANGVIESTDEVDSKKTTISGGQIVTNAGQIGNWLISEGDLISRDVTDIYRKLTYISPNNITTFYDDFSGDEYSATLGDGKLKIATNTSNTNAPLVFAEFTFNGTKYHLVIDTANGNNLKAIKGT